MEFFKKILRHKALQEVIEKGGNIYFVGGCVRDFFMKREAKDIDIVIKNLPIEMLWDIFPKHGTFSLHGESFGVFVFKDDNLELEIALPRKDFADPTQKGHKAITAQSDPYLSIEVDLSRRDSKMNSIAISHLLEVIDPFNGRADIENKIVSATSLETFIDDPLRMERFVTQAISFGFEIESSTWDLIQKNAYLISTIKAERHLMEIEKVVSRNGLVGQYADMVNGLDLGERIFGFNPNVTTRLDVQAQITTVGEFLFALAEEGKLKNQDGEEYFKVIDIADYFQERLKISNPIWKQLKALDRLKEGSENYTSPSARWNVFNCLQTWPELVNSSFLEPNMALMFGLYFPKSKKEIVLKGNEFIELGFEEKAIGNAQLKILDAMFKDQLHNEKEQIIKFLKNES